MSEPIWDDEWEEKRYNLIVDQREKDRYLRRIEQRFTLAALLILLAAVGFVLWYVH